jgi:O-antigen/teichoic acid export membrane protein
MSAPSSTDQSFTAQFDLYRYKAASYLPDKSRMLRWAPRGALAIVDQGLVSGSNFLLGVLLARAGGPEVYGAYMVMYAAFLLIANVYQALVMEPIAVLAPLLFPGRSDRYARTVLGMHAIFTTFFMIAGAAAVVLGTWLKVRPDIENALGGMVIATPCVLLFWSSRSFAYLDLAPGRAAAASALYCGILLVGLLTARVLGSLSPMIAYLCLGFASAGSSVFLLGRYAGSAPIRGGEPSLQEAWRQHWKFGRWGLGSVGLNWAQGNSISLIGGPLLGIRQIGGLNALNNLLLPMNQVLQASARLTQPRIAQIYGQQGGTATVRPVLRVAAVLVGLTTAYWLVLSVAHVPLMHLLYGERFVKYAGLLPILSLNMIGWAVITSCDIAFSSMQSPRLSFGMKMLMVAIMIPLVALAAWRFGLIGVAVSIPSVTTLTAILMGLRLRRHWQKTPDGRFS